MLIERFITGIELERDRMAKEWLYIPALVVLGLVVLLQRGRAAMPVVPAPMPS